MTSYVNDVIMQETDIKAGYWRGMLSTQIGSQLGGCSFVARLLRVLRLLLFAGDSLKRGLRIINKYRILQKLLELILYLAHAEPATRPIYGVMWSCSVKLINYMRPLNIR